MAVRKFGVRTIFSAIRWLHCDGSLLTIPPNLSIIYNKTYHIFFNNILQNILNCLEQADFIAIVKTDVQRLGIDLLALKLITNDYEV